MSRDISLGNYIFPNHRLIISSIPRLREAYKKIGENLEKAENLETLETVRRLREKAREEQELNKKLEDSQLCEVAKQIAGITYFAGHTLMLELFYPLSSLSKKFFKLATS